MAHTPPPTVHALMTRAATLDRDWFQLHAARDPTIAYLDYAAWMAALRKKKTQPAYEDPEARQLFLRRILEHATGLSATSIRHYIRGEDDPGNAQRTMSIRTLRNLDHITQVLDEDAPKWARAPRPRGIPGIHIAVLTQLHPSSVPSFSYHMRVLHGIVHSDSDHLFLTALHEVHQREGDEGEELNKCVRKLVRVFAPDAFVFIRLAPNPNTLRFLARENVPLILVHGDLSDCGKPESAYAYPPILANVVPDHRFITRDLNKWIDTRLAQFPDIRKKGIGVVSMSQEANPTQTIRNERIRKVLAAVEKRGLLLAHATVAGYSYEHAYTAYQAQPNAGLYICLSDQIAVGIKHLLMVSAKTNKLRMACKYRVAGFDDSDLAKREDISSFNQGIDEIGGIITQSLGSFFTEQAGCKVGWPESSGKKAQDVEQKLPVRMVIR